MYQLQLALVSKKRKRGIGYVKIAVSVALSLLFTRAMYDLYSVVSSKYNIVLAVLFVLICVTGMVNLVLMTVKKETTTKNKGLS